MGLQIGRAFTNLFKGEKWFENILIGMVVMVIATMAPKLGLLGVLVSLATSALLLGYSVRVMRQETTAQENALPDRLPAWDNWQGLLQEGVGLFALNFIWALGFVALVAAMTFATGLAGSLGQMLSQTGQIDVAALVAQSNAGVLILAGVVMTLFSLLYAACLPLMAVHYAHERRFTAGFELGALFSAASHNLWRTIGVLLISALAMFLAQLAAAVVMGLPFVFLAQLVTANLWAQVYRLSRGNQ